MVKCGGPRPVKAVIYDRTATRALDTIYQNNSGRPILCLVSMRIYRGNVLAAQAMVSCRAMASTPPTDVVCTLGLRQMDNVPEDLNLCAVFAVTPGFYYDVATTVAGLGSGIGLSSWIEVEL